MPTPVVIRNSTAVRTRLPVLRAQRAQNPTMSLLQSRPIQLPLRSLRSPPLQNSRTRRVVKRRRRKRVEMMMTMKNPLRNLMKLRMLRIPRLLPLDRNSSPSWQSRNRSRPLTILVVSTNSLRDSERIVLMVFLHMRLVSLPPRVKSLVARVPIRLLYRTVSTSMVSIKCQRKSPNRSYCSCGSLFKTRFW
jgi:hypothetical protein